MNTTLARSAVDTSGPIKALDWYTITCDCKKATTHRIVGDGLAGMGWRSAGAQIRAEGKEDARDTGKCHLMTRWGSTDGIHYTGIGAGEQA